MNHQDSIPVYRPYLKGNEKKYVNECLSSTWISSRGSFIEIFESNFQEFIGCNYATSVSSGTTALHVALEAIGVTKGDEVILPAFTYIASVNTVLQTGATPVFVECDETTLQVDPVSIEKRITKKTKAVMAVHLYGHSCDMELISKICSKNSLLLIEDCAEAVGTKIGERHIGTYSDVATFSFFGNKTITTGEGGMVVSDDHCVIDKVNSLKNQGISKKTQYWHDRLAYNYRMTNICAAIGLAQLESISYILKRKREIAEFYQKELVDLPLRHHVEKIGTTHSYWMCSIILNKHNNRDELRGHLKDAGIETRPFFNLVNKFDHCKSNDIFPISDKVSKSGINLPSFPDLTNFELQLICDKIKSYFDTRIR